MVTETVPNDHDRSSDAEQSPEINETERTSKIGKTATQTIEEETDLFIPDNIIRPVD
jgi:hypothetical protein